MAVLESGWFLGELWATLSFIGKPFQGLASATAKNAEAAKALLTFLAGPKDRNLAE